MKSRVNFSCATGVFVTGTDTEIGKTVVAGAIAKCLSLEGRRVGVFKPIATGCRRSREGLVSEDAEFLAHCSNCENPLDQINPERYLEPLAPIVASERANQEIDWENVQLGYENIVKSNDVVVVEGIGGVMVPICQDYLVLNLMRDMALPVIVVASSRLGMINHTLLTINICRNNNLSVIGVVINNYNTDKATVAEETNPRIIAEVGNVRVLTVMPYDTSTCVEKGVLGSGVLGAARLCNWADHLGLSEI
ncbi:MAG: dethiobiotin synthase [Planctomycetes bacterium]|nr:dethiobiotin synthase [Planctomycetota bacterium]